MYFFDTKLKCEYERWKKILGEDDPYASKNTVGIHEVLRAHFLILDFFSFEQDGEGVGGIGPKDINMLHSATYRQFVSLDGKGKWPTPFEKCATLMYGIVKDHPFQDANKRTGFLVALLFLERINRIPKIKQREFEDFVVEVADNQLEKYVRYKALHRVVQDPEVQFIAEFLKKNTREVDRRQYTVTFNELNQILKRYGFELGSPKGNYIDVVKVIYRQKYLGILGPKVRVEERICQIGFPGWKRQVTKAALRTVRETTGLTAEKGYDSKAFFLDLDPLHALIDTYSEPLRRLADR